MTIVEFLRARYADDERAALRAGHEYPTWTYDRERFAVGSEAYSVAARKVDGGPINDVDGEHIARHDPARVLREVEAKRQILEAHRMETHWCPMGDGLLRALALPYADHPDYDQAWAPPNG